MRPVLVALSITGLSITGCDACAPHPPPAGDAAVAGCTGAPVSEIGEATYYDAVGAGSCSFEPLPDHLVAALNRPDYGRAALCGACLAVAGPSGDVVVQVVDVCPGCKHGDLDLGREAFARIAPLSAGRTKVAWREVACPVTGPIAYQIKPGSNPSWVAIQLRNHRYPIAGLEARDGRGGYRAIPRGDGNYFVAAGGLGPGPYTLRVSDGFGHQLEDRGIAAGGGAVTAGAAQFPICP